MRKSAAIVYLKAISKLAEAPILLILGAEHDFLSRWLALPADNYGSANSDLAGCSDCSR